MNLNFFYLFLFINFIHQFDLLEYRAWNSITIFLALLKLTASYHFLFDEWFIQFAQYCNFLFFSDRREFKMSFIFHSALLLITTNNDDDSIWLKNESFEFFQNKKMWKLLRIFMKFWNFNFTVLFFDAIISNNFNCLLFSFLMSRSILIFFVDNQILFFVW